MKNPLPKRAVHRLGFVGPLLRAILNTPTAWVRDGPDASAAAAELRAFGGLDMKVIVRAQLVSDWG